MRKILITLLILTGVCFMLSACLKESNSEDTGNSTENTTSTPETGSPSTPDTPVDNDDNEKDFITIAQNGVSNYTIVYSRNNNYTENKAITDLTKLILEKTGAKLSKKLDTEESSAYEIIIGNTSRPETAKAIELMGDKDYILAIINGKLVIYSSNSAYYEFILQYVQKELVEDDGVIASRELCHAASIKTFESSGRTVKADKNVELSFTLHDNRSAAGVFFAYRNEEAIDGYSGYYVEITKNSLTLYAQTQERTEMASKYFDLEIGKAYDLIFDFDGRYLRCFLIDDIDGIEPWPEFELTLEEYEEYEIILCETSGYGADFEDLTVSDYVKEELELPQYTNFMIEDGADPDIIYHDGVYYMYVTSTGYVVYTSTDLINWEKRGPALEPNPWGRESIYGCWAPDVEYINGKFYMVISNGEDGLGIAAADNPLGPFRCITEEPLYPNKSIDGHIFVDDDDRIYLYCTSWCDGRSYGIWGVELTSDLKEAKWDTETLVISATEEWEMTEYEGGYPQVVEAPIMLKHNDLYYFLYSGSHYMADYAVGYAVSESPLGPFEKTDDSPILKGNSDVSGPGHCSVLSVPNSDIMLIVYHKHNSTTAVHPRTANIDLIRFSPTESGIDRLEVWGPTTMKHYATWLK